MRTKLAVLILAALVACGTTYAKEYATVNGEPVTNEDVSEMVDSIKGVNSFSELSKEHQDLIISQAIDKKLVQQQAKKEKIESDPKYKEVLKKFKDKLLVEVWMKNKLASIDATNKELQEYYDARKSSYVKKKEVKARHILVKDEQDAKNIIKELQKAKGDIQKKFMEIAKQKSIGPSGKKGGDLGWFSRKKMLKPFSDAAFALKEGEFTKTPVKTNYGYHIIYLDGKQKAYTIALKDIKEQLTKEIKMQKFQQNIGKDIAALKKEAKIVYK